MYFVFIHEITCGNSQQRISVSLYIELCIIYIKYDETIPLPLSYSKTFRRIRVYLRESYVHRGQVGRRIDGQTNQNLHEKC